MDPKNKDVNRLIASNETEKVPRLKGKEKARKELWDSLCAVYENENTVQHKVKLQQIKDTDEHIQDCCGDQLRHTKYDLKLNRKTKSRHLKNVQKNENDNIKSKLEKDKEKRRYKECDRQRKICSSVPEGFSKEEEKNVPSVIVLHKYKKGMLNSQIEPYNEEANSLDKVTHRPEKSWKKSHTDRKTNSQKQITIDKSSCNEFEVEGKHSLDYKQQLRDKNKKKRDKVVVYKTLSTNLDAKLRKKRRKLERQQTLKEVACTLNTDTDIYDKIKNLPMKIDENQLIFMHPSHVAKALEHIKLKKNNQETVNTNVPSNELNRSRSKYNNQEGKNSEASLKSKVLLDKNSSKKLKILSSIKKMKKSIPVVLEEKSDISFIKVSKQKKGPSKRRSKIVSTGIHKNILEEPEAEEKSGNNSKAVNEPIPVKDHLTGRFSVSRQNVCFGDNSIYVNTVHNKLVPPLNDSLNNYKSKMSSTECNLKSSPAKELKIRRINKKEMEKLKKLIGKNDENENKNQPDLDEDESKLTFQLLKSNANQKNLERLRKNVYSISDRMGSKENINPTEQNDRLYVTKRMLFYSNKESTSTSKESLNIAIRRDTEISNSGSSNNVLNVVIKQKKNSNTSTKSVNSPKLSIENKCSKHCDTKSLEKMFVENYIGQVYKNNDIKKCKQLKEAECQTEEITFSSDTQVGKMMEVSTQPFELSKNILQDEFRNFLTYHLKNMNPSLWNNNKISNVNEEEPDRNQHFQAGTHKLGAQSKLGDNNQPILLNSNVESLILKKQYANNECDDDASPVFHTKHYCNSDLYPFVKVLNSEEFNLQNSKCDQDYCVSKINAFIGKEVGTNIGNENKIILKPEVSIYENQCKKTESENIAEKLKNIGLSDKTSFIKVINSNNKLDTSIRKVNTHSVINFKTMKSPRVTKGALTKPFRVSMRENLKNGKTRRQRSKFFLPTNLMNITDELGNDNSLYSSYDQNIKKYGPVNSREKCSFEKNILDRSNLITNNFWHLEEKHINEPIITTGDNYNGVKQNFINVLSANDDMLPKARKMAKHIFEATKKNSYRMLRNFIGSGAGIRSETYDLQSVPYKNVGCVKIEQSKIEPIRDKQNTKEPGYFPEEPMLLNKRNVNKQISTYDISAHTPEKRPFLHVINSKFNTDMNENTNNVVPEKNKTTFHSFNFSESKDENSCIFKTTVEENQIVDKINAVYDFLQYLEKMLKDSSFLKVSGNTKNTNTIGHFNNTLRCLCNNCIDILNKIEVQKIENDNTNLVENLNSHPVKKALYLGQASGEIKNELHLNGINSSKVQYVTLNETKNDLNLFRDLKSNNESVNPFCVIVKQEEKSHNQNYGFLKSTDHFERENLGDNNHSFEFKEKSYEDFIKRKFIVMSDAISSNKIVNSRNIGNEENHNQTVNNSNDRFCKEIQGGHMSSVDNSSEIAQVNLASNNGCEAKSRLVVKCFNHSLNYQPLESQSDKHLCDNYFQNQDPSQEFNSKTYSSSVKNVSSKNNMGSPCPKNGFCQYVTSRKDLECVHRNQINNSETDKRNNINNSGQCNDCYHVRSCKNTPEATVHRNNEVEMKHKPTKLTCQHEIKSVSDSANFSNKSENTNYCMKCKMITPSNFNNQCKDKNKIDEKFAMSKCKDKNNIDEKLATSNNQRHTEHFDGSSNQMPFTNIHSPRGSIIIIKRNLQKDSSKYTSSSNSVEYLNSSSKCDHEREKMQESKEFDSDGWVPLNDITEIGNNQICLGMDINNMTVRHIEYVQKFPESFSNLK